MENNQMVSFVSVLLLDLAAINTIIGSALPSNFNTQAKKACKFIDGLPAAVIDCPVGQGKQSVGPYQCCVKCHQKCDDIYEARVLNGKPTDGCFRECTKCSYLRKPFLHYKNVTLNMCLQCKRCSIHGLVEEEPCGDLHNAQCVKKSHIVSISTPDSNEEAVTMKLYSPAGIVTFHEDRKHNLNEQPHQASWDILAAAAAIMSVVIIGIALLAMAIFFVKKLFQKKIINQNRDDGHLEHVQMTDLLSGGNDLSRGSVQTYPESCSSVDNNLNEALLVTGASAEKVNRHDGSSQNDVVNGCDDMNENEVISSLPSTCLTLDSSS